ncbi:unnamed protein product [Lactuca saligna]|uniref:Transposase-associated domain-containing protein n=1 Tax=Lactuca saligna TaxID=75948 RepID=A0AA35VI93_LACSI|nr:unnamed protein product [Lactuca saligna]
MHVFINKPETSISAASTSTSTSSSTSISAADINVTPLRQLVIMSTRSDRDWMYKRLDHGYLSIAYHASVKGFLDVAFSNEATVDGDYIRCPCFKCKNMYYKTRGDVELHLLQNGFTPNYTTWRAHGERNTISQHEEESSNPMQDPMEDDDDDDLNGGRDAGDRNASQSYNDAESQPSSSVRGSNILEQVPSNPSKRKFIEVDSEKEFMDQISVIRAITCILKTMFDGPWTSWKKVDKEHRDAMWEHFKGLYVWPEETDVLARKVWEDCMKKRFPDVMRRAREASLKLAKAANVNASLEGKNNRNKLEDGSVSKHTGGSISIRQHKKRMQAILKRPPTGVELYARLHTKRSTQEYITPKAAKVKEAYESAMVAKFGDDTSCHPLLDNETWCDVSGGVKKGRIYGFGSVSDPASFLEGTSSTITSQEVVYERVRNEMRGEMDAKAAEMEAKHQQMHVCSLAKYDGKLKSKGMRTEDDWMDMKRR